MSALGWLAAASALFVGTHFLMSHPLRAWLMTALGERWFQILYSLVAVATLYAIIRGYGPAVSATPAPLWNAGGVGLVVANLLMWFGSILFVGSLRRNPAFPRVGAPITQIGEARGVFAITRHPMNWGFAIWALVHAIVNPTPASLVVSAAILILAIGGSVGQDAKKRRRLGEVWREWEARTTFVPFARGFALPDGFAFIAGTVIFVAATYAHGALGYRVAGPWHWFA